MKHRWLGLALALLGCDDNRASVDSAPATSAVASATPVAASATPVAASVNREPEPAPPWLETHLRAADPRFDAWLRDADALRLQILVTVPARDGQPRATHAFRVDAEYFYPASAIKTFLAVATLRALRRDGEIHPGTLIQRCRPDRGGCEPPPEDEKPDEGSGGNANAPKKHDKFRIGGEIDKLLAYSDNDSYNRLWDIVGQRELNEDMAALGFSSLRFHHRMNAPAERSKTTSRVVLLRPGKAPLRIPRRESDLTLAPTPAKGLSIGRAHNDRGKRVEEPLSFANKNNASLRDLQRLELSLLFPDDAHALALGLSEAQRERIIAALTARLGSLSHAAEHHPLVLGVLEVIAKERLRYVSKSGRAYGFHLDNAYIEDTTTGRGFFVAVSVYANPNGVLNDDDYGYDETTRPLLAALGKALAGALLASPRASATPSPGASIHQNR